MLNSVKRILLDHALNEYAEAIAAQALDMEELHKETYEQNAARFRNVIMYLNLKDNPDFVGVVNLLFTDKELKQQIDHLLLDCRYAADIGVLELTVKDMFDLKRTCTEALQKQEQPQS